MTGCLGVFVADAQGQRRMVAHVPAGETVGEMSLLVARKRHSAQLVALRDTELLRIGPEGFEALVARHPRVMMNLMQHDGASGCTTPRAAAATGSRPKTFAIVPLQDGLESDPIAHRLAGALARDGRRAPRCWMSPPASRRAEWFNSFEAGA